MAPVSYRDDAHKLYDSDDAHQLYDSDDAHQLYEMMTVNELHDSDDAHHWLRWRRSVIDSPAQVIQTFLGPAPTEQACSG